MNYKLIIFDFDGTLADSVSWFLSVINEVAEKYKFRRIEPAEYPALKSFDTRKMIAHMGLPMWKLPLVHNHVRRRMTSDIVHINLFPGIDRLLRTLRAQGVALGIVSSNSSINVRKVLGEENASLIRHYACDAPILGKRAKLRRVLEQSRTLPSETIFIGDEIRDLQAAHAEGIAFGAVSWGVNYLESFSSHFPEETFSSVEEIADRVEYPATLLESGVLSQVRLCAVSTSSASQR
ncbi:MAG TPA: HAD hydrolase-like protein [Pyrinomonadaceae bacterium]|nr:HAD hydrolase-like protein [Pyrinomonadaceae bacterium]